ncbi:uncharacterized protein LOC117215869 isoform X1 [Bombus bifarius]|uniref:Uncharacterized protein LOC117215869 isoform X1 n=1 Tax=Bombus bifarius TaxID=103933 RepID=A0A6P8NVF5_9HYME|nr:uncharacterized protein LOC117215869 isoform X1 [Bombus bifarius]
MCRYKFNRVKSNAISAIVIVGYQESKRGCCAPTFSSISPSAGNEPQSNRYQTIKPVTECCSLRKCKYAKSQVETEFCNTQRLLDRIRHLKQSVQELECAQQQIRPRVNERKDAPCQTQDSLRSDVNDFREILDNCIKEMTKLKRFFDDENFWWKIFKKRNFNCCEQKLPHLHGYLDGTMVTLKILEEKIEPNDGFVTSTPVKSGSSSHSAKPSTQKRKYREQDGDEVEGRPRKYVDASVNTERIDDSYQDGNPVIYKKHQDNPGSSKAKKEDAEVYQEQHDSGEPQTSKDNHVADTTMRLSRNWYTKNAMDVGNMERPSVTFNSENMAKRSIIAADISTSMDILPNSQHRTIKPSIKGLKNVMERNFSVRNSFTKEQKGKIKRQQGNH